MKRIKLRISGVLKLFIKKTVFEYLAYILIVIGIAIFVAIMCGFGSVKTTDAGGFLSGTSGILWALAGVLLFFSAINYQRDDLKIQRDELSLTREVLMEQSETLKIQTTESTFFRLLENHRSLVASLTFGETQGYAGLAKFYQEIKMQTELYKAASITGEVLNVTFAQYYPIRQLKAHLENVEQLFNNILHIIKLVKLKLNDDLFYHETFYNSLSRGEKYILGLYVINLKKELITFFNNDRFNYLLSYELSGKSFYDKETIPFFPNLNFNFRSWGMRFLTSDFFEKTIDKRIGELKIMLLQNEEMHLIRLVDTIVHFNFKGKDYYKKVDWTYIYLDTEVTLDIFDSINETIFKLVAENFDALRRNNPHQDLMFQVKVKLTYNDRQYIYQKHFKANFNNMDNENEIDYADFSYTN